MIQYLIILEKALLRNGPILIGISDDESIIETFCGFLVKKVLIVAEKCYNFVSQKNRQPF